MFVDVHCAAGGAGWSPGSSSLFFSIDLPLVPVVEEAPTMTSNWLSDTRFLEVDKLLVFVQC